MASAAAPEAAPSSEGQAPPSTGRTAKTTLLGLQPPTPEQRAQALASLAASEAAQSAPPVAPASNAADIGTAKTEELPVARSNRKATLLGVAPEATLPSPAVEPKAPAATQVGFAAPAPVMPSSQSTEAAEALRREAAARAATAADAPTPIEVPISGADSWRGRVASDDGSKPTGVAKAYHPKSEAAPPVVVDETAMRQGQAAAQAEQAAQLAARRRNINAVTIPGTVRVVPRGAGTTPDIEPIDMTALKPSKKPLVVGLILVLLAGGGAAAFALRGSPKREPAPPALRAEPTPKVEATIPPPPPPPEPSAAEASSPEKSEAPAASANAAPSEETAPTPTAKSAAKRPAAPAPKPAAVKKSPAPAPAKQRATATQATAPAPAKAKGVIVRDSPF